MAVASYTPSHYKQGKKEKIKTRNLSFNITHFFIKYSSNAMTLTLRVYDGLLSRIFAANFRWDTANFRE